MPICLLFGVIDKWLRPYWDELKLQMGNILPHCKFCLEWNCKELLNHLARVSGNRCCIPSGFFCKSCPTTDKSSLSSVHSLWQREFQSKPNKFKKYVNKPYRGFENKFLTRRINRLNRLISKATKLEFDSKYDWNFNIPHKHAFLNC